MSTKARSILLLAFPDVQLLDVSGPLQVFASANELAAQQRLAEPYAPRVVAAEAGLVTSSSGPASPFHKFSERAHRHAHHSGWPRRFRGIGGCALDPLDTASDQPIEAHRLRVFRSVPVGRGRIAGWAARGHALGPLRRTGEPLSKAARRN
jgi:hypothetical protein